MRGRGLVRHRAGVKFTVDRKPPRGAAPAPNFTLANSQILHILIQADRMSD